MNGAKKMTNLDVERLREILKKEKNISKISREFETLSGEKISREHIASIRDEKRWNETTRSYLMKDHYAHLPKVKTEIVDGEQKIVTFETKVGVSFLPNPNVPHGLEKKYLIFHVMDDRILYDEYLDLEENEPTEDDLLHKHLEVIVQYV